MSRMRGDQSIQSANTPTSMNIGESLDHALYRCMVIDYKYADDSKSTVKNAQNPQMLYEVIVLGGFKAGQRITNVRMMNNLGGDFNYSERVLKKSTKVLVENPLTDHDGDIVYIQFVQGNTRYPVIVGLGVNNQDEDRTGSIEETGPRMLSQFNGVLEYINKDGEWSMTRKGGEYSPVDDFFTPADETEAPDDVGNNVTKPIDHIFEAEMHWKDNEMLWRDNQSSIKFQQTEKLWTHRVGKQSDEARPLDADPNIYEKIVDGTAEKTIEKYISGLTIQKDGKNDKITTTYSGGLAITADGAGDKMTITTAGGLVITHDGAGDKTSIVTAGGAKADIDGSSGTIKLIDNGTGALKITNNKVAMGSNVAELLDLFDQTLTAIQVQTHIGNLGVPTGVPINAAVFAAIQALLLQIKGTL